MPNHMANVVHTSGIEHSREPWVSPAQVREKSQSWPNKSPRVDMTYSGVASFEEIVNATMHGFNMEYDFSSAITAFGMLARGNAYINKLSLGQDTPLVPPLPGAIDGPKARGLSAHGRFEGDGSMTRQDAAIGDNVHFQPKLFAEVNTWPLLLDIVAQLGDDSPSTGPHSIINKQSLSLFKFNRFQESQASNVKMQYHIGRLFLSYAETGIVLKIFANGTDGTLSVPTLTSILRDQRFPDGWFRRSSPATFKDIVASTLAVFLSRPVLPGANSPSGIYIPDISIPGFCAFYANLASDNLPGALLNTTGVLKDNVDFLLKAIHNIFPRCPRADPRGPANA
ncbi:hypothetical protein DXG01_011574 [Tephrocybe rancida]|nr:hypothetical protein DXG01_011574 [Tephrocybe rancida]